MRRALVIVAASALAAAGLSAAAGQASAVTSAEAVFTTRSDPHFGPADRAAALRQATRSAATTAQALRLPRSVRLHATDAFADTNGDTHTRYARSYAGMPVIGGDLIVHRSSVGGITAVDYASKAAITVETTRPAVTAPAPHARLVVFAARHRPVLAWESRMRGHRPDSRPIDKLVYTSALDGERLAAWSRIDAANGTGSSLYSGTVGLSTVLAGAKYRLDDRTRGGSLIYDANNSTGSSRGTLFTDADNVWGSGTTSSRQSAAVDAAYGAASTWDFYRGSFGRTGIRNNGVAAYSRVHYGTKYQNAFWSDACFCMTYGDGGSSLSPLVSLDVAGHEMSHGVTAATAALTYSGESGGLNEATSDIFGTMVEFSAGNSSDRGDYYIGEKIARDGTYLRRMDHPSLDGGSADCWSSGVGKLDVHYSSGVGNHLFYLLAEGSGPKTIGGRAHNSPTCNGARVAGIGRDPAAQIWYRALTTYMTSTTNYKGARDATIKAARDLYGANSSQCATVVGAWNAVAVPVGAEACAPVTPPPGGGCNVLLNPGFESGAGSWARTSGVISTGGSAGPRTGSYVAWLDGYGSAHTDTLSQSVAVPPSASASLSFYLKVTSSETTASNPYDSLNVRVVSNGTASTLATFSNLNKGTGYVQRTLDLSGWVGKTVTVQFVGTEDSSLATSFRVDDTALTTA